MSAYDTAVSPGAIKQQRRYLAACQKVMKEASRQEVEQHEWRLKNIWDYSSGELSVIDTRVRLLLESDWQPDAVEQSVEQSVDNAGPQRGPAAHEDDLLFLNLMVDLNG